jgi:YHS domain-containing protein
MSARRSDVTTTDAGASATSPRLLAEIEQESAMKFALLASVALVLAASLTTFGDQHKHAKPHAAINVDANAVAVLGADIVLLHSGKNMAGDAGITSVFDGAIYRFASTENRDMFKADPAKYAPQYGGYCAFGVTKDALFPVELSTAVVVDGKLYLNKNPDISKIWKQDLAGNIKTADTKWPTVSMTK